MYTKYIKTNNNKYGKELLFSIHKTLMLVNARGWFSFGGLVIVAGGACADKIHIYSFKTTNWKGMYYTHTHTHKQGIEILLRGYTIHIKGMFCVAGARAERFILCFCANNF